MHWEKFSVQGWNDVIHAHGSSASQFICYVSKLSRAFRMKCLGHSQTLSFENRSHSIQKLVETQAQGSSFQAVQFLVEWHLLIRQFSRLPKNFLNVVYEGVGLDPHNGGWAVAGLATRGLDRKVVPRGQLRGWAELGGSLNRLHIYVIFSQFSGSWNNAKQRLRFSLPCLC